MHKYLNIILGDESNPTSINDNDISIKSIDQYFQASISSWQTHQALAREAFLYSLEPTDLLKVISCRDNASAI